MTDMFSFDVFSVCHSLGQAVTGIALFIFWLICHSIQNVCLVFEKYFSFTVFALMSKFASLKNIVCVKVQTFYYFPVSPFVCMPISLSDY